MAASPFLQVVRELLSKASSSLKRTNPTTGCWWVSDTGSINSKSLGYLSPSFEVVISTHQPVIPNLKMKFILFAWFISFSATTLASPTPVPAPSTNDTCLAEGVGCKFIAYGINYPLGTCCSPLTCTGFTELDSTFLVRSNITMLTSYFALSLMTLLCRLVRNQRLSLCDDEHGHFRVLPDTGCVY